MNIRLTTLACADAAGTRKYKALVIGKSASSATKKCIRAFLN